MKAVDTLSAALTYAESGQPVFPCDPATKRPFASAWPKSASTDPDAVKKLWRSRSAAMIGLPTGEPVGAFVIDIDAGTDKESGEVFEAAALLDGLATAIGCPLPATRTAQTPRGGLHLWFRMPVGEAIGNRAGMIPRIDVRGTGGYVIAPPSVRSDGKAYAWQNPDAAIADAPPALIDLILRRGAFGKRRDGVLLQNGGAVDASGAQRKYALSGLDAECQSVKNALSGQRNTALHNAAANVAELVASGILDEHAALAAVRSSADSNPGDDSPQQIEATIQSGWGKGIAKPRDLSAITNRSRLASHNEAHVQSPSEIEAMHLKCCRLPMTDMGNAERFAARNHHRARWVDKSALWAIYDGRRWTVDGADAVVEQWVYQTVRLIGEESCVMASTGRRDQGVKGALDDLVEENDDEVILLSDVLAKWAIKSEAHGKFSRIKSSARPLGLTIQPEEFDRNPFLINCENGTLQVIEGQGGDAGGPKVKIRPHEPTDLITRLMPVRYDPKARAPFYDGFLDKVQPDEAMRRFLHQPVANGRSGR
jgi:putative DNA primase/helicase